MNTPGTPAPIAILVLAAGASSRMKSGDKLVKTIEEIPLLRHAVLAATTSQADFVITIFRPRDPDRRAALKGIKTRIVTNPDWQNGMASSIRAGLAALPETCEAVLIALADMPGIGPQDYNALIAAYRLHGPDTIQRACDPHHRPGNPVLFPKRYFPALLDLSGDRGARDLLAANRAQINLVPLPGDAATCDLDTQEDWAAYLATQP